jgi:hypothetical protein
MKVHIRIEPLEVEKGEEEFVKTEHSYLRSLQKELAGVLEGFSALKRHDWKDRGPVYNIKITLEEL